MALISGIGHGSDHGGTIISGNSKFIIDGIQVSTVGCLHSCPIPGHGVTAIATGSSMLDIDGLPVAKIGSVTGCGATITEGFSKGEVAS